MTQTPKQSSELFPTYVVGSLPRPAWLRKVILDRRDGLLSTDAAERLLDSAIPSAIAMQERAGIDFISDGEWRRESYIKVVAEHVDGFEFDRVRSVSNSVTDPAVVAPIAQRDDLTTVLSEFRAQGLFDARSKVPLTSICIRAFRIFGFCDGEYRGCSGMSAEF